MHTAEPLVPEPSAFESEMVVEKLLITSCVSNYSRTDSNRRWGIVSSSPRVQTAVSTTHVCPVYVSRFALLILLRLLLAVLAYACSEFLTIF